jgi:NIPSNAP protein
MVIKYGITTGAVALVFAAGFLAGRDTTASAQGNRVFEIRTYTTENKAGLDALVSRMGGGESQLFAKSGMSNIGHFVAADAPKSENTYVYIVAHENQEKAKASWAKFREDPDWVKLRSTATSPGQIKVESVFVNPTTYSTLK